MSRDQPQPTQGSGRRIVVVEDNADLRAMLGELLSMCGHVVYLAGTGREALELIAAHEPDVALVDLGLPDMNGRDVARRVRASGQRVRLAALTGQDDSDDRRSALEAGFDEYLTKPVEAVTVLALVER